MLTTLVDKLLAELDDTDLIDLLSRVANEQHRRQRPTPDAGVDGIW
jgi:hypothetical protein